MRIWPRFAFLCHQVLARYVLATITVLSVTSVATLVASDSNVHVKVVSSVSNLDSQLIKQTKVLDVRPQKQCIENSVAGAVCMPLEDLFADNSRLANFSGVFWLLGTLGLSGAETVTIVGASERRRLVMAGLLYAAGQREIVIFNGNLNKLIATESGESSGRLEIEFAPGSKRSTTRTQVFTELSRTHLLLTRSELIQIVSDMNQGGAHTLLLDGRTESEYWGRQLRAIRGGHIPGAVLVKDMAQLSEFDRKEAIVYGHDPVAGLALLAQFLLSKPETGQGERGVEIQAYLGGWREWGSDTSLPVDAETFSDKFQWGITTGNSTIDTVSSESSNRGNVSERSVNALRTYSAGYGLFTAFHWVLTIILLIGLVYLGYRQRICRSV